MANAKRVRTIDWSLGSVYGHINQAQRDKVKAMSKEQLAEHKAKVKEQCNKPAPLGPHPWKTKTCGWVQAWFTKDVDLRYHYTDWGKGLTVEVNAVKPSGTVSVLCRSEYFNDKTGALALQENPWRQQITVNRALTLIRHNEENWAEYVTWVQGYEKEKRAKWEEAQLLRGSRNVLSMRRRGGELGVSQRTRGKRKVTKQL